MIGSFTHEKVNVMKKRLILGIMICSFIILTLSLKTEFITTIDQYFYNFLISFQSDKLTGIMKFITNTASAYFLILLTLTIIIFLKNTKVKLFLVFNLIFSTLLNRIIKILVQRDRPSILQLVSEKGYSFPSGHTMSACFVYGFIIYLILKSQLSKTLKIIFSILITVLIILIGVSRIYLGVHYFSDVLGAIIFSGIYLIIFIKFYENVK